MQSIKPKKSFGQNFLVDTNMQKKIVLLLNCKSTDNLIEIGPGTGLLTRHLLEYNLPLTAVELDTEAIAHLRTTFPNQVYPRFQLKQGDIRSFSINQLLDSSIEQNNVKVIGNIPYYISSDILFWLFEQSTKISTAVITVQKEVAERLIAKPRTKDYGILTVACGLCGQAQIAFNISPECFSPRPKVTSATILLQFDPLNERNKSFSAIMKLVRAAFNQRRKMLRNALEPYIYDLIRTSHAQNINNQLANINSNNTQTDNVKISANSFIDGLDDSIKTYFTKRAEELSTEDFCLLYENFISYEL